MLSNLLPGLRELRAPFAAGVLWVLAAWMALEPDIPTEVMATGVAWSVYRLRALLQPVAAGAAAGFIAYLVGSLSVAISSDAIKASFPVHITRKRRRPFNTLSPAALGALYRAAAQAREDIEAVGEFTTLQVEEALMRHVADLDGLTQVPIRRLRRRVVNLLDRLFPRRRVDKRRREIMRHESDPSIEERVDHLVVRLVVSELDAVSTVRLLGKEPDLYSAIDRHRAEVEFRVAVMPPLLALFLVVATRADGGVARLVPVIVGVVSVAGLYWDALKQQRQSRSLLIDAASYGRVQFLALEQLTRMVAGVEQMSRRAAAHRMNARLKSAIDLIGKLDSFAPSALAAVEATDNAARLFDLLRERLSPEVRLVALQCVDALKNAAKLWDDGVHGNLGHPWVDRGQAAVQEAVQAFDRFKRAIDDESLLPQGPPNGPSTTPDINTNPGQAQV